MKKVSIIIASLLLLTTPLLQAEKTSKSIHQQMHSQLLADNKNNLDKSSLQDYFKLEMGAGDVDAPMKGLSRESSQMIGDILIEAKSHMGKKYVYGSKGPNTFDCSGFTGYVYKQFGYKISASSRGQYTDGVSVKTGELRPGDLVFFTSRNSNGGVGHVGLVVSADNENKTFTFIHASVSNGIRIDHSTTAYYKQRYVGARRIITE